MHDKMLGSAFIHDEMCPGDNADMICADMHDKMLGSAFVHD